MYKDVNRLGLDVNDDELEAMIEAEAAKAESKARTKGATRQQLAGREEMALKMLRSNITLRTQKEVWEKTGILTTPESLRAYFKRYFPEEWAAYLSRNARGRLKNRLLAEPVGAEKEEIEAFLQGKPAAQVEVNKEEAKPTPTPQVGVNKQEATPDEATTAIAAKSEKAGGIKTAGELLKNANAHNLDQYDDN